MLDDFMESDDSEERDNAAAEIKAHISEKETIKQTRKCLAI